MRATKFLQRSSCVPVGALSGMLLISGCSWVLPHPVRSPNVVGDADTPRDGRCSLAIADDRKSLSAQVDAQGVPAPLVIHLVAADAGSREIRNDHDVYFEASHRDADSVSRAHEAAATAQKTQPAVSRLTSFDKRGALMPADAAVVDGSVISLKNEAASSVAGDNESRRFMLYKVDVPDSTRPTTCDERVRDQDFVFLRLVEPSVWARVSESGLLNVQHALSDTAISTLHGNPLCARQQERCHNDPRGGLVCAWAPECAD